jgi:hypothetical protein
LVEPPPLDEWLVGREILTVKQDGSAMFTKIQDALDALKPGQVVEVLDKGPYRETLNRNMPTDTGLITRASTHVILRDWQTIDANPAHPFTHQGHSLGSGLRLSGFIFSSEPRHEAVLMALHGDSVTVEECVFPNIATYETRQRGVSIRAGRIDRPRQIVVRDCVFGGEIYFGLYGGGSRLTVTRNHFRAAVPGLGIGCVQGSGANHEIAIRENVFDRPMVRAIQAGMQDGTFNLAGVIERNTILAYRECMHIGNGIPAGVLRIEYNVSLADRCATLVKGAEQFEDRAAEHVLQRWNGYSRAFPDADGRPLHPSNLIAVPKFISDAPDDRNYARLVIADPFASAESAAGGKTYYGALPPGPAPPEGDWFTRLQERWKVAITLRRDEPITPPAVPEATSNDSSDSTPPGSSRRSVTATLVEPPPLDKWLKGRKILTVKQDGSAMFTKIQDALDALKSGQVVEVLDKGPYREQIQTAPPDDTALVSRCQTEIHAPTLVADDACCVFAPANGFRLLGIAFIDKSTEPTDASAAFFKLLAAGNVWVSDCLFDASRSTMAERRLFHTLSVDARSNAKVMVFESVILGGLRLAGNNSGQIQVKKSCIRLAPHRDVFIRGYSSEPMEAILELNVIHSSDGNSLSIGTDTNTRLSLRLLGNTIVSSVSGESPGVPALGAQASAAADQLVAERNIFVGHRRFTTLTQSPASIPETWQLKRNAISHVDPHDDRAIPLAENETKATPEFFSREESDRNYMRVKPTGAFSVQPDGTFIGALPPGPAPPEGDWFTRLQERWKVAITPLIRTRPSISAPILRHQTVPTSGV